MQRLHLLWKQLQPPCSTQLNHHNAKLQATLFWRHNKLHLSENNVN